MQRQEGFNRLGPHQPHILAHHGVADGDALGLEPLQDLLRAQVVGLQPAFDQRLVWIELAAAARPPQRVVLVFEPVADGFLVQLEPLRDLADAQFVFLPQRTNLAVAGVRDHGWPPCSST